MKWIYPSVNEMKLWMMDLETPNKSELVRLVQKYMSENNKTSIERGQFIEFCAELNVSSEELDNVFTQLDSDKDGRINASDFTASFEQVAALESHNSSEIRNGFECVDKSLYECHVNGLESPMNIVSQNG